MVIEVARHLALVLGEIAQLRDPAIAPFARVASAPKTRERAGTVEVM